MYYSILENEGGQSRTILCFILDHSLGEIRAFYLSNISEQGVGGRSRRKWETLGPGCKTILTNDTIDEQQ